MRQFTFTYLPSYETIYPHVLIILPSHINQFIFTYYYFYLHITQLPSHTNILLAYYITFKTELFFTNEEVTTFINYMEQRNTFLGATNFMIWLVIISALVVTALNKIDAVKKKS